MTEDELIFKSYGFQPDNDNITVVVKYDISDKKFKKISEEELEVGVKAVGKVEAGECVLYRLKDNDRAEFPVIRRDMWVMDREY